MAEVPPANDRSLLDKIEAGTITAAEFEAAVIDQVYAGMQQYCEIPAAYRHCELTTPGLEIDQLGEQELRGLLRSRPAEIINPSPAHIKAIEFFSMLLEGDNAVCDGGDPLAPTVGAYLYGPPGTGKTHIMATYGRSLRELLDRRLRHVHEGFGEILQAAFKQYTLRMVGESRATEDNVGYTTLTDRGHDYENRSAPADEFWEVIGDFQRRLTSYRYQPTDLIYIGFKELVEVVRGARKEAMTALETARIVFIDDIHPQGDPAQVQIVLHLLERRYELGRAGTFLTTNLETRELGGGDEMLGRRLLSRCAETLLTIDFSDCQDWRQTVKARRSGLVDRELERRIANRANAADDPIPDAE